MARLEGRHPAGVAGEWFVDTRCMDCDAARQVAPGLIARNPGDGVSVFTRQPHTPEEIEIAWRAVMVCPTRSVGRVTLRRPDSLVFPDDLGDGVHRLGHNSTSSFGAHSYLARRPGGNLMFDAPRWAHEVAGPVEELGGLAHILLSHRDDVAEADRYAEHFGARVWIHVDDREAAPYATDLIDGTSISTVAGDVVAFRRRATRVAVCSTWLTAICCFRAIRCRGICGMSDSTRSGGRVGTRGANRPPLSVVPLIPACASIDCSAVTAGVMTSPLRRSTPTSSSSSR